jgi:8-oxo-dGTP pyrophosphatase MutT (NUDIX family)
MSGELKLTRIQWLRTRLHLFLVAVRKRLTVGVRGVVLDGDRVLLIRPTYLPGWQFPGGGVEPGETAAAAAAREVLEETGVAVEGQPLLHGLFLHRIAGSARDHVAVYVWRSSRTSRAFRANLEIADCRWFALDALPAELEAGTGRRLREIREGLQPPAAWQD